MSRYTTSPVLEKSAEEEPAATSVTSASSLCVNCDNADGCALPPRASALPVVHCEEWVASGPVPEPNVRLIARLQARDMEAAAQAPAVAARTRGLCATCESYSTCSFVKPDEGVWHCEEYS